MSKIRIIITLILALLIASCSYPNWNKPNGRVFKQMPKGGSPGFELGWIHGCESGLATDFGGAFFMTFYQWKRDKDLIKKNIDYDVARAKFEKYKLEYKRYSKEWNINWEDEVEVSRNLSDYKKIFWNSHIFCRHFAVGTHQTANGNGKYYEPPLPGERRYNPAKHSIGQIWTIHGRGHSRLAHW